MSVIDKLLQLKEHDPDVYDILVQLAKNARDESLSARVRLNCAMALGDALTPLMMDNIAEQFEADYAADPSGVMKQTLEILAPTEPKYEYQFVRGARVKVRVN